MELVIRSSKFGGLDGYVGSTYQAQDHTLSLSHNLHTPKRSISNLPFALKQQVVKLIHSPRLLAHTGLMVAVTAVVLVGGINAVKGGQNTLQHNSTTLISDSGYGGVVDGAASIYIASDVAQQLKLPVAQQVSEHAQNVGTQVAGETGGSQYLAKTAAVAATKTTKDIQAYMVKEGDTLSAIAQQHGISTDTLAWANDLTVGSKPITGTELRILPVNGVLYTIVAGDSAESLAGRFQANAAQIISYNDLEVTGLQPGVQIIIPDGIKPQSLRQRVPDVSFVSQAGNASLTPRFGGNGYDYGYCTWYAANRRGNGNPIPSNWGNAAAWKYNARSSGFGTGSTPQVGAVAWERSSGYLGHVAYVEGVNSDGSVTVSEMNYNGWGVVSRRTVPAGTFDYIY